MQKPFDFSSEPNHTINVMRYSRTLVIFLVFIFCAGFMYADDLRQIILDTAQQYQGVPYRYGGTSPNGFDCSGFVSFVYRTAIGMDIPKSSQGLWETGVPVDHAEPGDVIVFAEKGRIDHVAILLDAEHLIHAVSAGPRRGVIISPITERYFATRMVGARSYLYH